MPATTTESPFQAARRQRQVDARQAATRRSLMRRHRQDIEAAIELDRDATRHGNQLLDHAEDRNGFRQRVQEDRTSWWLWAIFWGAILLYVVAEFLTSGDVSDWLANQIAPLFQVDAQGGTPIWLRRVAGCSFVGIMLGVTLLLKFVTTWFKTRFQAERSTVQAEEAARHWRLTAGIWATQVAMAAYLAGVAFLYTWLFGFAQERAMITASIAAEQQTLEWTDLGVKIEGGTIETDEAVPKKAGAASSPPAVTGSRLAWATGVVYICLWCLHALVMLLPTDGFGRDLELAHFKRGAVERRMERMRTQEEGILRGIYERIMSVDGNDRDALVRITYPVARRLNATMGQTVMEVPPATAGAAPENQTQGEGAHTTDNTSTPQSAYGAGIDATAPTTGNGAHPSQDSGDAYAAIFGRRA